jgi:hypothetical protein
MKINELTTNELKRIFRATTKEAGVNSPSAKALRAELQRRENLKQAAGKGAADER